MAHQASVCNYSPWTGYQSITSYSQLSPVPISRTHVLQLTRPGFETTLCITELESTALDRSATTPQLLLTFDLMPQDKRHRHIYLKLQHTQLSGKILKLWVKCCSSFQMKDWFNTLETSHFCMIITIRPDIANLVDFVNTYIHRRNASKVIKKQKYI